MHYIVKFQDKFLDKISNIRVRDQISGSKCEDQISGTMSGCNLRFKISGLNSRLKFQAQNSMLKFLVSISSKLPIKNCLNFIGLCICIENSFWV